MGCKKNEWVDRAPTSSSRAQLIGNTVNNPAGNSPGNVVFVPLTGAFQNPVPSSVFLSEDFNLCEMAVAVVDIFTME